MAVINGTSGADTIAAPKGNNIINAGGGDDVVTGGSGKNIISGGDGNDILYGGGGNDAIYPVLFMSQSGFGFPGLMWRWPRDLGERRRRRISPGQDRWAFRG